MKWINFLTSRIYLSLLLISFLAGVVIYRSSLNVFNLVPYAFMPFLLMLAFLSMVYLYQFGKKLEPYHIVSLITLEIFISGSVMLSLSAFWLVCCFCLRNFLFLTKLKKLNYKIYCNISLILIVLHFILSLRTPIYKNEIMNLLNFWDINQLILTLYNCTWLIEFCSTWYIILLFILVRGMQKSLSFIMDSQCVDLWKFYRKAIEKWLLLKPCKISKNIWIIYICAIA